MRLSRWLSTSKGWGFNSMKKKKETIWLLAEFLSGPSGLKLPRSSWIQSSLISPGMVYNIKYSWTDRMKNTVSAHLFSFALWNEMTHRSSFRLVNISLGKPVSSELRRPWFIRMDGSVRLRPALLSFSCVNRDFAPNELEIGRATGGGVVCQSHIRTGCGGD